MADAMSPQTADPVRAAASPAGAPVSASATVGPGEAVGLLAPPSSDLSGLMHALAGRGAMPLGLAAPLRQLVASVAASPCVLVLANTALLPWMSCLENVRVVLAQTGGERHDEPALTAQALRLLARLGVEALASCRPAELDVVAKHRVALARALAAGPAVLLLDHPFTQLTGAQRAQLHATLLNLLADGQVGVLLASDDAAEALTVCDRVLVLDGAEAAGGCWVAVPGRPARARSVSPPSASLVAALQHRIDTPA